MKKIGCIYIIAIFLLFCNIIIGCDHINSITGTDDIDFSARPPTTSQPSSYDTDISGATTSVPVGDISGVMQ